jgi:hypothetical protein
MSYVLLESSFRIFISIISKLEAENSKFFLIKKEEYLIYKNQKQTYIDNLDEELTTLEKELLKENEKILTKKSKGKQINIEQIEEQINEKKEKLKNIKDDLNSKDAYFSDNLDETKILLTEYYKIKNGSFTNDVTNPN